jgi:hypothetical protein
MLLRSLSAACSLEGETIEGSFAPMSLRSKEKTESFFSPLFAPLEGENNKVFAPRSPLKHEKKNSSLPWARSR